MKLLALDKPIKIINSLGIKKVENYCLLLGQYLKDEFSNLGGNIISPKNTKFQFAIVISRMHNDSQKGMQLSERLLDEKIFLSIRYTANQGGLMLLMYYFNNEQDVLSFIHQKALKSWLKL